MCAVCVVAFGFEGVGGGVVIRSCVCDPCDSVVAGIEPDMRLGDVCVLCCGRECDRCGADIPLDAEHRVSDGQGYVDVCDGCLRGSDVLYEDPWDGEWGGDG